MNRELRESRERREKEYRRVIGNFNLQYPHIPILIPEDVTLEHLQLLYEQVLRLWKQELINRGDRLIIASLRESGQDGIYDE